MLVNLKKTTFCLLVTTAVLQATPLIIHEHQSLLFALDPVSTEFLAYKLLKNSTHEFNTHYLAIPWTPLINRKQLEMLPNIKIDGGFTICQHVRYAQIIPILEKIGITVLFTPHAIPRQLSDKVKILPFPHYAVHGTNPAPHKDILYSFIGMSNHPTRKAIFNFPVSSEVIIKKRTNWHWWQSTPEKRLKEKLEYQDVLARSRFSLCPRGVGPSTIRFWESLQAGAIPVVLADDFMLPEGIDWSSCIIRVPENKVHKLDAIIRKISPEQEQLMRINCLKAYQLFSEDNFISNILAHYSIVQ